MVQTHHHADAGSGHGEDKGGVVICLFEEGDVAHVVVCCWCCGFGCRRGFWCGGGGRRGGGEGGGLGEVLRETVERVDPGYGADEPGVGHVGESGKVGWEAA